MKPSRRMRVTKLKQFEDDNDPETVKSDLRLTGRRAATGYAIRVIVCRARRNRCPE